VNFAKPVRTDQVAITLRAGFPQETFLKECTIECSNGFTHRITLQKTTDRQVFRLPIQGNVTWLKLTNFEPAQSDGWADFVAVEILGIDN